MELHLREEQRMIAAFKIVEFKRRTGYYNKKVRACSFVAGDLVLRREDGGKLDPKWEGPYVVGAKVAPGAYRIKNCEGETLGKTWNADCLKKSYP